MEQAEFHQHIGAPNICPNIKAALERAAELQELYRAESGQADKRPRSHPVI